MENTATEEIATDVEETPIAENEAIEAEDVSAEDKAENEAEKQDENKELNEFTEASREAMQKRVDRANWQREQQKREYESRIAEMEQKLNLNSDNAQSNTDGAPNEDDFDDVTEYYKELGKYEAKQAFKAEQAKQEQAEQQKAYQAKMQAAEAKFNEQAKEVYAENPEAKQIIDDLVQDWSYIEGNEVTKQAIVDVMMASDNIPRLMLEVSSEIKDLATMQPLQAVMKLGEINARIKSAPKPKTQPKPKPMSSLKGSGKTGKDTKSMSGRELLDSVLNS